MQQTTEEIGMRQVSKLELFFRAIVVVAALYFFAIYAALLIPWLLFGKTPIPPV